MTMLSQRRNLQPCQDSIHDMATRPLFTNAPPHVTLASPEDVAARHPPRADRALLADNPRPPVRLIPRKAPPPQPNNLPAFPNQRYSPMPSFTPTTSPPSSATPSTTSAPSSPLSPHPTYPARTKRVKIPLEEARSSTSMMKDPPLVTR